MFEVAAKAAGAGLSLIDVAIGWFESSGDLLGALPMLHELFRDRTIDDIALVGAAVWNTTENGDTLRQALTACKAWDDVMISRAVAATLATYHDVYLRKAVDDRGQLPCDCSGPTASLDIIPFGRTPALDPLQRFGSMHWRDEFLDLTVRQGEDNRIYVRAANAFPRGPAPGQAKVSLYWAPGSVALSVDQWRDNKLLTAAGDEYVDLVLDGTTNALVGSVPFVWKAAPERYSVFSLIARVTTPYHPNPLPDQTDIRSALEWLRYRPGFACKNVINVVRDREGVYRHKHNLHVRNHDAAPCRFMFVVVAINFAGAALSLFTAIDFSPAEVLIGSETSGAQVQNDAYVLAGAKELPAGYDGHLTLVRGNYIGLGAFIPVPGSSLELRFYALLTPAHPAYRSSTPAAALGLGDGLPVEPNEQPAMLGSFLFLYL
jgi:hypothetical protein